MSGTPGADYDAQVIEWAKRRIARVENTTLTPSQIAEKMRRLVVGQDQMVRTLSVALHHHLLRHSSLTRHLHAVPRSAILLIGPTGCGKTLGMRSLSAITGCPFVLADASRLTDEGFVGASVGDVLGQLLRLSLGVQPLASLGIVGLDEVDKLRAVPSLVRDVSGVQVQHEILSLLESPCQEVVSGPGKPKQRSPQTVSLDTSGIMVLLAGAFVGLDDIVAKRVGGRKRIGFGANGNQRARSQSERDTLLQQLVPEDLVTFGIIPELVGRLTDICVLDGLTKQNMRRILLDAENGPLKTTQAMAQAVGFEIRLTPPLVNHMVEEAMRSGLGARHLLSLVRRATGKAFFEMPDLLKRRSKQALLTFGVSALRDGGYETEWRKQGEAQPADDTEDEGDWWEASSE
jgi:ATP-dependent Clp protease ATP-binding subunit ClpX